MSKPKAHRCRDTAAGHARSLNARGAEPAPQGVGAHRASGRVAGRELGVPHSPAGERAGRLSRARPRGVSARGRCDGAARQSSLDAGQGADPGHTQAGPRRRRSQRHQRPVDGQHRGTGSSGLPPTAGWALRQP
jgi:hypothetical protein